MESISTVLQRLMKHKDISVTDLSDATGVNRQTLYSMLKKTTSQADIIILKSLADFFQEDLTIFCGLPDYEKAIRLNEQERLLLSIYRNMSKEGQSKIMDYVQDLGDSPKYRRR